MKAPIYVDDTGSITMMELRSKARRLKAREPALGLIVVDYLQLMTSGGTVENRVQEVSQISRNLKVLARDLDVPILALSQLSRAVEQRHDKRPILSDLRESGSIEQDADLVLFVYRDEYYNGEESDQQGLAELILAKHRNGPTDRDQAQLPRAATRSSPTSPAARRRRSAARTSQAASGPKAASMSETETSTRIRASKMWAVPAPSGPVRPPRARVQFGEVLDVVDVARHLLVGSAPRLVSMSCERPPPALAVYEHGRARLRGACRRRGDRLGVVDEGDGVERRAEQDDLPPRSTTRHMACRLRKRRRGDAAARSRTRQDPRLLHAASGWPELHGAGPRAKRLGKPAVVAARPARGLARTPAARRATAPVR